MQMSANGIMKYCTYVNQRDDNVKSNLLTSKVKYTFPLFMKEFFRRWDTKCALFTINSVR